MKKYFTLLSLSICLIIIFNLKCYAGEPKIGTIRYQDITKKLKKHSIYTDSAIQDYYSGGLIGNGLLGATIYKEEGDTLCWELGRVDVVDHRKEDYPLLYKKCRLPIGKFLIPMHGGKSSLLMDFQHCEVSGKVSKTKDKFTWKTLTPACHNVYIIEMQGKNLPQIDFRPDISISPRYIFRDGQRRSWDTGLEGYGPNPKPVIYPKGKYTICKQPMIAGGEYTTVWTVIKTRNKQQLIASVAYSRTRTDTENDAIHDIEILLASSVEKAVEQHLDWWRNFYSRSYVSVGDDRYDGFFWSQLYKLGSATRPDKYVIDLMGPWYHNNTPWCAIWWNLNIQLTYSPMFAINHCDLTMPLWTMLDSNIENLQKNAPKGTYPSVAIGRASSYDCLCEVSNEHGLLMWILFYYDRYCNYTHDYVRMKEKFFPLLKLAVNHYRNMLFEGEDGYLHLPKTHSPEYADAEDCNFELALLRWGCQTLIDTDKLLGIHDELLPEWKKIMQKLTPYPMDSDGFLIGKNVKLTSGHRHYSHLLMLYPLENFPLDNSENLQTANKSIDFWLGFKNQYYVGYTYTGAASMKAIQGDGEQAYVYLNVFFDKFLRKNTLYGEDGPCFESPMSALATFTEMLLRSHNGIIYVLPAVPAQWENIRYDCLLAENGFEVSARKEDGVIQDVCVKSLYGGDCKIKVDIPENYRIIEADSDVIIEPGKLISVSMPKGGKLIIRNKLR